MKEVLVLGGGGFIGRNIVQYLIDRGDCKVTAADLHEGSNWSSIKSCKEKSRKFTGLIDDFSKPSAFEKLNRNYDEIYMLAALVGVNKTLKNPQEVIRNNTLLTINTLAWIKNNPVRRLRFSSSSENYAGTSDLFGIKIPTDENVPLTIGDIKHPRWTYALTKIHGESAFIHSAKSHGYDYSIVRYQNIIGPEMGFGHAIPHIVERFSKKKENPFKVYGHDQTRAFCYIDDAVSGTVKAMEREEALNNIYHIGNQDEITIQKLTEFIGDLMGYHGEYQSAMTYPGSVSRRCPDITKAKKDLGYSPIFSWEEAVQRTVEWYREYFSNLEAPKSSGFEPPENFMEDKT